MSISSHPAAGAAGAGATIDVAGLQNVELPASYNFIAYSPRGTEFADTPLQRDSALFGQTLWIDIRAPAPAATARTWVGTPLGNANGFVNDVRQSIDLLMTKGGTVSLTTDTRRCVLTAGCRAAAGVADQRGRRLGQVSSRLRFRSPC